MREKQVPVDVVEMKGKKRWILRAHIAFSCFLRSLISSDLSACLTEGIIAFAWEPNGSKFAVLHGEAPRISVSFYHVKNNGKIDLISECSHCDVLLLKMFILVHDLKINNKMCFRNVWQATGQQHLLESTGAVFGLGWVEEVCTR